MLQKKVFVQEALRLIEGINAHTESALVSNVSLDKADCCDTECEPGRTMRYQSEAARRSNPCYLAWLDQHCRSIRSGLLPLLIPERLKAGYDTINSKLPI